MNYKYTDYSTPYDRLILLAPSASIFRIFKASRHTGWEAMEQTKHRQPKFRKRPLYSNSNRHKQIVGQELIPQVKKKFHKAVMTFICARILQSVWSGHQEESSPYNRPRRSRGQVDVQPYSFMTSALKMEVGGQRHAPAALTPGKNPVPIVQKAGEHQGRCGRVRKISPLTRIRSSDRPARCESLYRLSHPGPQVTNSCEI